MSRLSEYLRGRQSRTPDCKASSSTTPSSPPLDTVNFFSSQIGDQTVINYSYTDDPWRLLAWDTYYFFYYSWALPYILFPYKPAYSGELSELSPTRGNIFCVLIHTILVILQLGFFLVILPLALFIPLWTSILIVGAFMTLNIALCALLNGNGVIFHSDPNYARPNQPRFAHEQWIFLNGVAVGSHWMKSNLNRLALTFGRPIIGVHNRTSGILFDVVECLVQRNFGYATTDIRVCYRIMKEKLYDPQYSKVVFVLHSQGGIEGGMVLDWLLQELPQNLLCKLEVYTFGNAANHFNNPFHTVGSQTRAEERPLLARWDGGLKTLDVVNSAGNRSETRAAMGTDRRRPHSPTSPPPPPLDTNTVVHHGQDTTSSSAGAPVWTPAANGHAASSVRAIGHIEHYAFVTDFVALWGVLHFATTPPASRSIPRFIGRLFARTSPDDRGGHQLVQHYLDEMFPLERDSVTGQFVGCKETNDFMESVVKTDGDKGEKAGGRREGVAGCWEGDSESEEGEGDGERVGIVEMHNGGSPIALRKRLELSADKVRVKELSRLWKYRNGRSPTEKPPSLERAADGVVRGATM